MYVCMYVCMYLCISVCVYVSILCSVALITLISIRNEHSTSAAESDLCWAQRCILNTLGTTYSFLIVLCTHLLGNVAAWDRFFSPVTCESARTSVEVESVIECAVNWVVHLVVDWALDLVVYCVVYWMDDQVPDRDVGSVFDGSRLSRWLNASLSDRPSG